MQDDPHHEWPSWRQVLHDTKHGEDRDDNEPGGYWITPPDEYAKWDAEFGFDCDPFPFPRPDGCDALAEDVEWGEVNYVNASFRQADEGAGRGLTEVCRKAITEARKGKTIFMPMPCTASMLLMLDAGAEVRPLGRVKWLHTETREPWPSPVPCLAFVLRGSPPD